MKWLESQLVPVILIIVFTVIFMILERVYPGRPLPKVKGWYARAIFINAIQVILIGVGGLTWNKFFREYSLFKFGHWHSPFLEGLFYWFFGTFVFYWWHRIRHRNGFWVIFHQIHHSPSRIEALTSFYKHPVEIAADSILTGFLIYCVFGGSAEAGAWTSFFGATGEYFYHSNLRTPRWVGYFLQRPEYHAVHHQLDIHKFNYGDITWWDRLFGTFKEAETFIPDCGFPRENERHLSQMMRFKDVYDHP